MKYGFIIDNRKCIGCHACTTACKSEHDVPIGVNRTYVKQVEKGEFPNTRRVFSVMRCNHCTDAPCVNICPVEALFTREDGIVDFDNNRCIGCKSCMQACPYDALYIDPDNNTAAKCNYCAHRVDVGREPACVSICPEHAIIAGDMDNPNSEISELLSRQQVKVRKPEKGTNPNLFYIDGDDVSLIPEKTEKSITSLWGSQAGGVGHYAKNAEKMMNQNLDVVSMLLEQGSAVAAAIPYKEGVAYTNDKEELVAGKDARRVYDTPDKGILWGWEVSAYVTTKAISAGGFLIPFIAWFLGYELSFSAKLIGAAIGVIFLGLTGVLLIMDLDRPDRFLNVLLRPQWKSWLVRGGYTFNVFGGLISLWAAFTFFEIKGFDAIIMWTLLPVTILLAIYTAFLFAQAKGRDFWQSPSLAVHMLLHSILAGAAIFSIVSMFDNTINWSDLLRNIILGGLVFNLFTMLIELTITHPTEAAHRTVEMILHGRYKNKFWIGVIGIGNVLPIAMLLFGTLSFLPVVAILVIAGIYLTESIWVEAPQRIPLA